MSRLTNNLLEYSVDINPSKQNIQSQTKLFDEASVVFGLFIGYLLNESTEYKVEEYYSLETAYIGIQLRGATAIIGTICMVLSSFINYSTEELFSIDIKDDPVTQQLKRNNIFRFLCSLQYIQQGLHLTSYLCLTSFIMCYAITLYSLYHHELNFFIFTILITIFSSFLLILITYVYYQKRKAIYYIKKL